MTTVTCPKCGNLTDWSETSPKCRICRFRIEVVDKQLIPRSDDGADNPGPVSQVTDLPAPELVVVPNVIGVLTILGALVSVFQLWPRDYIPNVVEFAIVLSLAALGIINGVIFFGFAKIIHLLHDIRGALVMRR